MHFNNLFEKPKKILKNTFLAGAITAGVVSEGDATAQTIENAIDRKDMQIEHTDESRQDSFGIESVEVKNLKKLLKSYEAVPGQIPIEMFLEKNSDKMSFLVTQGIGATFTSASLSAHEILKKSGLSPVLTFTRQLPNSNIEVLLLANSQ